MLRVSLSTEMLLFFRLNYNRENRICLFVKIYECWLGVGDQINKANIYMLYKTYAIKIWLGTLRKQIAGRMHSTSNPLKCAITLISFYPNYSKTYVVSQPTGHYIFVYIFSVLILIPRMYNCVTIYYKMYIFICIVLIQNTFISPK